MADEVELARQKLWALYRYGYHGYLGDAERWESMMKRLVPELHANPYFRWFVTEANSSPVRRATKLLDTITPDMPVGKDTPHLLP